MAHPLAAQVTALNTNLPSHLLQNLLITSQAISLAGSTNLSKAKRFVPQIIGTKQALEAQPLSNYQRLIRFFNEAVGDHQDDVHHCIQDITAAVIGNFRPSSLKKARHLVIDGSKWKARREKVQFLSLCVVVENTALPIASIDLAKIGHSSQKERGAFLDRAAEHLDLRGMILLGDREYVGIQWFKDLKADRGIDFVVRVKKGIYHEQINAAPGRSWEEMHRKLERNKKTKTVSKPIVLGGQTYRYVIARNSKAGHPNEDDYIYFLTSLKNGAWAAKQYPYRWQIEVTFKHLKSNGFDLEKMRVEGVGKHELMMAIVSMLFAIMVLEGTKFYRDNPRAKQVKEDHCRGKITLVHSTFRQGYDIATKYLTSLKTAIRYLNRIFRSAKPLRWTHV